MIPIFVIILVIIVIVLLNQQTQKPVNQQIDITSFRADLSDPLIAIKDSVVREAIRADIETVLNKYPELPKTDQFKKDVAFIAVGSPEFFSQKIPDMDIDIVKPVINNILQNKLLLDSQSPIAYQAILDWGNSLGDLKCRTPTEKEKGFGQICSLNPVDQTYVNIAMTLLNMYGLPWKATYGVALAIIIFRSSYWTEAYVKKKDKIDKLLP